MGPNTLVTMFGVCVRQRKGGHLRAGDARREGADVPVRERKTESRCVPPKAGGGVAASLAEPAGGPSAGELPVFFFVFFFLGDLLGEFFADDEEGVDDEGAVSFEPDVDGVPSPCKSRSSEDTSQHNQSEGEVGAGGGIKAHLEVALRGLGSRRAVLVGVLDQAVDQVLLLRGGAVDVVLALGLRLQVLVMIPGQGVEVLLRWVACTAHARGPSGMEKTE